MCIDVTCTIQGKIRQQPVAAPDNVNVKANLASQRTIQYNISRYGIYKSLLYEISYSRIMRMQAVIYTMYPTDQNKLTRQFCNLLSFFFSENNSMFLELCTRNEKKHSF